MIVADRLGLSWQVRDDRFSLGLPSLAGLAVRDNPKRAHLVVSTVLAKHVPVVPSVAFERAGQLASLIDVKDSVVLGFCETATGLGHAVADALSGADYVHTTRRPDPSRPTLAGFEEEHSHATGHHLQPPTGLLDSDRTLVLVDDELTTGTTALNTIEALPRRSSYVLGCLLDLRSDEAREAFKARCAQLGADVRVVALISGSLDLPADVLERGLVLRDELRAQPEPDAGEPIGEVRRHEVAWPAGVPRGGRHGFLARDRPAFDAALAGRADAIAAGIEVDGSGPVLVVGTEELMHLPNRLALELERRGLDVRVQSTTRSPVLPLDVDGYAVRRRLVFPSTEDPGRTAYLYNVTETYADIVVVTEDAAELALPLAAQLRPWASRAVHVVAV